MKNLFLGAGIVKAVMAAGFGAMLLITYRETKKVIWDFVALFLLEAVMAVALLVWSVNN
jgi:hypothetical protein